MYVYHLSLSSAWWICLLVKIFKHFPVIYDTKCLDGRHNGCSWPSIIQTSFFCKLYSISDVVIALYMVSKTKCFTHAQCFRGQYLFILCIIHQQLFHSLRLLHTESLPFVCWQAIVWSSQICLTQCVIYNSNCLVTNVNLNLFCFSPNKQKKKPHTWFTWIHISQHSMNQHHFHLCWGFNSLLQRFP